MKYFILLTLLVISNTAYSIEVAPHPEANITIEQWNSYHDLVLKKLNDSRRAYDSHKLEVFSDDETRASIAFTMSGHEAHPSWVTRHVVEENGTISMQVIGYFVGDEKAFQKLFSQYQAMVLFLEMVKPSFGLSQI